MQYPVLAVAHLAVGLEDRIISFFGMIFTFCDWISLCTDYGKHADPKCYFVFHELELNFVPIVN